MKEKGKISINNKKIIILYLFKNITYYINLMVV